MSRWLALALGMALGVGVARARDRLPVFLADNHAETFGWVAEAVELDLPYTLVLVDAHSDSSAVERSEEVREQLRRVASLGERAARVEKWRTDGRVQAFNWIESLMPRPFDQVIWAGQAVDGTALEEARAAVDGRLEVEPRGAGSLAGRWARMDFEALEAWEPGEKRVILAVDLDAFAGVAEVERERQFERIWVTAMRWEGLCGVAFAVSRPWLTDDAEADALVRMACEAVARTRGAVLTLDLSVDDRTDASRRAEELGVGGTPRWDAAKASTALRSRMVMERERWNFRDRKRDWAALLDEWRGESGEIGMGFGVAK